MKNIVFSTKNIDDLIREVAIEVVKKLSESRTLSPSDPAKDPEHLLNIKEAAKFLHLSVATVYSKVSKGELPVMKRSKRLYFSNIELLEYLKKGRVKTNVEIEEEASKFLTGKKSFK